MSYQYIIYTGGVKTILRRIFPKKLNILPVTVDVVIVDIAVEIEDTMSEVSHDVLHFTVVVFLTINNHAGLCDRDLNTKERNQR